MKSLLYFKFSIFSFTMAFIIFAYSLLTGISRSQVKQDFEIKGAFIGLFSTAIVVGAFLDLLAYIFKRTWYRNYKYTISIAIWSISISIISFIHSGGGHGLGTNWIMIIFKLPSLFLDSELYHLINELALIIIWILLCAIQGAAIGLVIDIIVRKSLKAV